MGTIEEVASRVRTTGIIAIVRTSDQWVALEQAERVLAAGLDVVEVSLTTPGAIEVIATLSSRHPEAVVGAGTVLDAASAEAVIAAGARIVVSPTLEQDVVTTAVRHDVAAYPGCLTPSEMAAALRLGASAAKIFPAHLWTPAALAGLLQALPDLPCVPTGGVGPDNAAAWIAAGAVAVGVGSALTAVEDPAPVAAGLVRAVAEARAGSR